MPSALCAVLAGVFLGGNGAADTGPAARLRVRIRAERPHDREAFTQGLEWYRGKLYESTGLNGHSSVRRVDPATGRVEAKTDLAEDLFGEGLARVEDELVQLTWQSGKALVWGVHDLARVREYAYRGEGWGLCYDGARLVMSDGSSFLTFRDPRTFRTLGRVQVRIDGRPLERLNELECVDDLVYANVWQSSRIARINPESGRVTAMIEASGLLSEAEERAADVLNGIAFLPDEGAFYITGKLWPRAFIVDFVPAAGE